MMNPLTTIEWAVICAVRAEPQYRFQYNEAKIARRMEGKGLIKSRGDKMYNVTAKGKRSFEQSN